MGETVVENGEGSLVWVQRKEGTWWPGRVLSTTEISNSPKISTSNFSSRFPIKLLGRDNNSVFWYNLEKSRNVKAFRCGEFDDCIKKAESSNASSFTKLPKDAHREDAILYALQFEKQQEKLKKPGQDALRPRNMKFKVTKHGAAKEQKHKGKVHNQHLKSRTAVPTNEGGTVIGHKSDPILVSCQKVVGLETKSHETSVLEETSSRSTTQKNRIKALIDVHITVQGGYRGEHIPLVSLTSGLNGKAIVGHPINIQVLDDKPEVLVKKAETTDQSRMPQLVWRKSKRSPVCYITKPRAVFLAGGSRCKKAVEVDALPYCVPVNDIFIRLIGAFGKVRS